MTAEQGALDDNDGWEDGADLEDDDEGDGAGTPRWTAVPRANGAALPLNLHGVPPAAMQVRGRGLCFSQRSATEAYQTPLAT